MDDKLTRNDDKQYNPFCRFDYEKVEVNKRYSSKTLGTSVIYSPMFPSNLPWEL